MTQDNVKIDKEELRKKQAINEESEYEINKLKTECFSYHENIEILKEVNNNMMKEITLKREVLDKFKLQYESISHDSSIKTKEIERHFNEFVVKNIPIPNYKDNLESQKMNEFQNLLFDYIQIKYVKYNYENHITIEAEDEQKFKVSQRSSFYELKVSACNYWSIDNYDEYYFTDESEALIYDEKMGVNDYFLNYSTRDRNLKLLTSRVIKERNQLIFSQSEIMREKNKFNKDKGRKKNEVADEAMVEEKIKHEIRSFNKEFPSLKQYMMTDEDQAKKKLMKNSITSTNKYQAKNIETSFFMLIVLVLFYVFNLYFIFGTRDIGMDASNIAFVNQIFSTNDISNLDNFRNYMVNVVGKIFPSYKNETGILKEEMYKIQSNLNFLFVSPIKIVVVFTNLLVSLESRNTRNATTQTLKLRMLWDQLLTVTFLFTVNQVNINTELTNIIGVKRIIYETPKTSGVKFFYSGYTGEYNGEGYVITLNQSMRNDEISNFVENSIPSNLNQHNASDDQANAKTYLVDKTTRAWIMTFTLFFPGTNKFMNVIIPIEILPTGLIYAGDVNSRMFLPNIYEGYNTVLLTDVFRILCLIILFFFFVIDVKNRLQTFPHDPTEWVSLKQMFSIFIFVVYLVSFSMKMVYLRNDTTEYYLPYLDTYKDTYTIAYYYNEIYFIESLLFEGVSVKILDFLILNDNIKLFFDCIHIGFKAFFKYILFVLLIYFFYAIISYIIYGPFVDDFYSYQTSFASILLISMGYYDLRKMLIFNQGWGTMYFLSFFLVIILFLNIVFISLFAESVKKTVVQYGYPDDYDDTQWQFKDYIVWLCHFVDDEEENKK